MLADENDIFGGRSIVGTFAILCSSSLHGVEAGGASAVGEALGGREVRDHRAVSVYERVQKKLTGMLSVEFSSTQKSCSPCVLGRDFDPDVSLPVKLQVDKLILQATSLENLCQLFSGW